MREIDFEMREGSYQTQSISTQLKKNEPNNLINKKSNCQPLDAVVAMENIESSSSNDKENVSPASTSTNNRNIQNRLNFTNVAQILDRYKVSNRTGAAIVSATIKDIG